MRVAWEHARRSFEDKDMVRIRGRVGDWPVGLAGGPEAAGKRLLVRLRHCGQVRMETGADAPIYHWVG